MHGSTSSLRLERKRRTMKQLSLPLKKARNKRHRDAEAKRRDDQREGCGAKKERMKREMMASIDTTQLSENGKNRKPDEKNEIGIKMNKIAAAKLKLQDEEVKKRLRNKKIYRRDLIRQISEDNARKAKARAAMDEVERNDTVLHLYKKSKVNMRRKGDG